MAVPKRRMSRAKSRMRKTHWQRKAVDAARLAISLGGSLRSRNAKGFFYKPAPLPETMKKDNWGFVFPVLENDEAVETEAPQ